MGKAATLFYSPKLKPLFSIPLLSTKEIEQLNNDYNFSFNYNFRAVEPLHSLPRF